MDEEKKKKVVDLFKAAAKPRRRSKKPEPATIVRVNGDNAQVAARDINNHINERKVVKNTVIRDPSLGYISKEGAHQVRKRVEELVALEFAAGDGTKGQLFAKWHKKLKDYFRVSSYLEIPATQEQQAIEWLRSQKVLRRPKIRRANNDMWRADHYRGIWARSKELGLSKADVYAIVRDKIGKQVVSLKQLGERDLKSLYRIIFSM